MDEVTKGSTRMLHSSYCGQVFPVRIARLPLTSCGRSGASGVLFERALHSFDHASNAGEKSIQPATRSMRARAGARRRRFGLFLVAVAAGAVLVSKLDTLIGSVGRCQGFAQQPSSVSHRRRADSDRRRDSTVGASGYGEEESIDEHSAVGARQWQAVNTVGGDCRFEHGDVVIGIETTCLD